MYYTVSVRTTANYIALQTVISNYKILIGIAGYECALQGKRRPFTFWKHHLVWIDVLPFIVVFVKMSEIILGYTTP